MGLEPRIKDKELRKKVSCQSIGLGLYTADLNCLCLTLKCTKHLCVLGMDSTYMVHALLLTNIFTINSLFFLQISESIYESVLIAEKEEEVARETARKFYIGTTIKECFSYVYCVIT